jgi:hypothetical protein
MNFWRFMKPYTLLYLLLFIIPFTTPITAQNGESSISGFIYDSSNGEALLGANVYLPEIVRGAATNTSGYYVIPGLSKGSYLIKVSFVGYRTFSQKVDLTDGQDLRLDIQLTPEVILGKEVVVSADSIRIIDRLFNKPVSKIELTLKQIGKVPQAIEADLLRTLQSLPGIVPISDFSSAIYVRGGTPDQNLFMVDGADVYNPEHAFGIFSTFNTDAIKKVEIYKGGFGAEFGGRLSSVVNVTNNDGNRNHFQGKVSLSLLSLNTTLQMPLGSIGSLSGSLRRTYLDQTIAKWVDEVPDYYFIDGNLKAFLDLDKSNKLIISYFGSRDDLNFILDKERAQSFGFDYVWGNNTGSINWRTIITTKLFGNFWITGSRFYSYFDLDAVELFEHNLIRDFTLKGNLEYFYSDKFDIRFGFENKNISGKLIQEFTRASVDVSKHRRLYTLYLNTSWKPNPLWDIEAGLRADFFDSDVNYKNLDPRLSIKYRLSEIENLKFSTGIYHQYTNRIPRLFFVSIWTTADEYIQGSQSTHFVLGYQREIASKLELEVEAYYKDYKNLYSYNQTFLADVEPSSYDKNNFPVYNNSKGLFDKASGKSYGIEFLLRKDIGAITGWVAYSIAKTEYTIDKINKGNSFSPRHDRTQTINIVANADLNNIINEFTGKPFIESEKKWSVGLSFSYLTGQPITLPGSIYVANPFPDWPINQNSVAIYPSEINAFRLPSYARLDLNINYEIKYDGWSMMPYLQIFNLLNRKNVWFIEYENEVKASSVNQKINNVTMFPILPSIGVTINF